MVDTNSDPELVNYVIPGNDDGRDSIKIILNYLAEAVLKGKEQAKDKGAQQAQAAEAAVSPEVLVREFAKETLNVVEDDVEATDALKEAKVKRFKEPAFQAKVDSKKKIGK